MDQFDAVWYGKAGVWIGSVLLVLMAVSGKQVAFVTVLAVLGVGAGVSLLLYSIPFGSEEHRPEESTQVEKAHDAVQ